MPVPTMYLMLAPYHRTLYLLHRTLYLLHCAHPTIIPCTSSTRPTIVPCTCTSPSWPSRNHRPIGFITLNLDNSVSSAIIAWFPQMRRCVRRNKRCCWQAHAEKLVRHWGTRLEIRDHIHRKDALFCDAGAEILMKKPSRALEKDCDRPRAKQPNPT